MDKQIILDGEMTQEERIASWKEFFGLSPEQDFSDLPDTEDEPNNEHSAP